MLGRKSLNSKYFRVFQRQTVPWAWHCVILESLWAPWLGFLCMRMPWSHQISLARLCPGLLRLCWSCSVWHCKNNLSKTQYEEHVRYQEHHKPSNNNQSHFMWRLWQLSLIMDPTASFRDLLPSAFFLLFVFPYFFLFFKPMETVKTIYEKELRLPKSDGGLHFQETVWNSSNPPSFGETSRIDPCIKFCNFGQRLVSFNPVCQCLRNKCWSQLVYYFDLFGEPYSPSVYKQYRRLMLCS